MKVIIEDGPVYRGKTAEYRTKLTITGNENENIRKTANNLISQLNNRDMSSYE